jgi:hypothetical protein
MKFLIEGFVRIECLEIGAAGVEFAVTNTELHIDSTGILPQVELDLNWLRITCFHYNINVEIVELLWAQLRQFGNFTI